MNVLKKVLPLSKHFRTLYSISSLHQNVPALLRPASQLLPPTRQISITGCRFDLMEFFDNKKNWGEQEVKHGRAWTKDDLRIKSNGDLHQLWYVLLKERNMLLTMEHECKQEMELFPSPERIDKVNESMKNLEDVVRERNRAYYELETGETGERPGRVVPNQLGVNFFYRASEHVVPKYANTRWKESHKFYFRGAAVHKFRRLYRERLYNEKRKQRNRDRNEVMHLLRRFPNIDRTTLAERFPKVNIDRMYRLDKIRGNYEPQSK